FAADMAAIAIWTDHKAVVIGGIILSGAFIGNCNTLITEAVMGSAPVERPVASAAYSFVRFTGGAVGPFVAMKLAEHELKSGHSLYAHSPYWFGAAALVVATVVMIVGGRVITRTIHPAAAHSVEEAEAILVGDAD
ncbi:MAG TPA: MFS transporter, partial [Nocardioides sp.]|nr:MFS transporter [Nocardioides sp.]